ncbi:uncharacterized [Tachysurus ichikawai]
MDRVRHNHSYEHRDRVFCFQPLTIENHRNEGCLSPAKAQKSPLLIRAVRELRKSSCVPRRLWPDTPALYTLLPASPRSLVLLLSRTHPDYSS